jgi:uncharacterized protein (TIGR03118 family)
MVVPSLLDGLSAADCLRPECIPVEFACRPAVAPDAVSAPWGVAADHSGTRHVCDTANIAVFHSGAEYPERRIAVSGGRPTGIVLTEKLNFFLGEEGAACIVTATLEGAICGWNHDCGDRIRVVADRSAEGAAYRGIAVGRGSNGPLLYATDSANGRVDRFDSRFQYLDSFTDTSVPESGVPVGIAWLGGEIFVTFAGPDSEPGNGCVGVFSAEGRLLRCLRTRSVFNAPTALVLAPTGFGIFGKHLLIGNRGDGTINAFDADTGAFAGRLRDERGAPVVLRGLRAMTFGPDPETLFVTTGTEVGEERGRIFALTFRSRCQEGSCPQR